MDEPGGNPLSKQSLCLVTGEATPLVRPLQLESPDPPDVSRVMVGMGMELSAYARGV